ncbi:unnamed protein product, partial [Meganyctiphanes norvegica]
TAASLASTGPINIHPAFLNAFVGGQSKGSVLARRGELGLPQRQLEELPSVVQAAFDEAMVRPNYLREPMGLVPMAQVQLEQDMANTPKSCDSPSCRQNLDKTLTMLMQMMEMGRRR